MTQDKELQDLTHIFRAGLAQVDPYQMIINQVTCQGDLLKIEKPNQELEFDLRKFERIVVLGAGKATAKMALAIENILGTRISEGLISVKHGHIEKLNYVKTIQAGHPVPDDESLRASQEIADICRRGDERTLFINLISGGGSALLSLPAAELTPEEKRETTSLLLACGADIGELNGIRKHLSGIKGGQLAALMAPATSLNLILSDVVGDRLDTIASGLTAGDETTFAQAMATINKYQLADKLPGHVLRHLEAGVRREITETPAPGDPVFHHVHNILIGTNYTALLAAQKEAENLGYHPVILSSQITGEAREAAKFLAGIGKDIAAHDLLAAKPACLIAGGETTVTLRGKGLGGRNQEMALAFLAEIQNDPDGTRNLHFLSAATDGNDGPTDAAGGFASHNVLQAAQTQGLSIQHFLSENNSYAFFDKAGYLYKTGPTNTNVCDLQMLIVTE